ncbi:MAG TPA: sterol desaturase family protein [Nitrosomonas halophila]|nr:sterol desaturase family protein [Nitrosomonas halophila]
MLAEQEALIRAGCFLGILILMASWEVYAPRRKLTISKWLRWRNNLSLTVLNTILIRLVFPVAGTGMAVYAASNQWGLFNQLELPAWLMVGLSLVLLDLVIYGQHLVMHSYAPLWRLHRVHHADLDIDVTTGARFHPLEMLLSMLVKFCAILLFGVSAWGVLLFEIILNAMAMFNHSNIRLPGAIDRRLRILIVTPDMHRVHHSTVPNEMHSNFGFNLAIWDRIFGTYRAQPQAGHIGMTIGLAEWRDQGLCSRLANILMMPFRR